MPRKRERVFSSLKEVAALVGMHPATVAARARAGTVAAERNPGTARGHWTVGAERSPLSGRWRLIPRRSA